MADVTKTGAGEGPADTVGGPQSAPQESSTGVALKGAWYVAAVLGLTNFFSAVDRFITGVLMVPIKADLGLTDTQVGLIQGLGFALLYALCTIPMGWLADRFSRRNIILVGTLVWTAATAACAFADSFTSLFFARVATGFGEASLLPAAMSLLAAYFGRHKLGRAISLFNMSAGLGKAASFIIIGWLVTLLTAAGGMTVFGHHFQPWQAAFMVAGLAGFPLCLLLLTIREPAKPPLQQRPAMGEFLGYARKHSLAYVLQVVCGVGVLVQAILLAAWGPSFFVRSFDLSLSKAGLIVGLISLLLSPVMIVGGLLVDRLNRMGVRGAPGLIIGIAGAACIPCAVVFTQTDSLPLAIAAFALAEVCVYVGAQPTFVAVQLMSPTQHRGLATALYFGIGSILATGLGPPFIGMLSDNVFDWAGVRSLAYAMMTAVAIFGLLSLATGLTRGPYSRAFNEQRQEPG